jgi:hypothetical protein
MVGEIGIFNFCWNKFYSFIKLLAAIYHLWAFWRGMRKGGMQQASHYQKKV